jgi:hypothetical protein
VHGIPGVPVDVYIDDELALEGFEFGSITDSLPLGAGDHDIAIRPPGDQDAEPILGGTASVDEGTSTSLVAYLDGNGEPTLGVFANDASLIPAGDARLTVRHTAAAPMLDILLDGEPVLVALSNRDEQATDIGEGTYSTSVAPAGSTSPILGPAWATASLAISAIVALISIVALRRTRKTSPESA